MNAKPANQKRASWGTVIGGWLIAPVRVVAAFAIKLKELDQTLSMSVAMFPLRPAMVLIGCSLAVVSCTGFGTSCPNDEVYRHTMRMAHNGSPLDITRKTAWIDKGARLSREKFVHGHATRIANAAAKSGNIHIMIYIHGAPIVRYRTLRQVKCDLAVAKHENPDAFPIFFNWKGSFLGAYSDHLWNVRQGQEIEHVADKMASTVRSFVYDLAGLVPSIATAPAKQIKIWRRSIDSSSRELGQDWCGHVTGPGGDPDSGDTPPVLLAPLKLPAPSKLVMAMLAQPFGASAWRNYRRRADAAIFNTDDYSSGDRVSVPEYRSGALAVLVQTIVETFKSKGIEPRFTLIGHSTGAIVVANLVAAFPNADFRRIVFLGAAATIRDFNTKVVPYLRNHGDAKFFNVSLHPAVEARSSQGWSPYGSVLELLDNHFTQPAGETDRVMGKWDNVVAAAHTIDPQVRCRVTLKRLPAGDAYRRKVPQSHSELGQVLSQFSPFCERCWTIREDCGSDGSCRSECSHIGLSDCPTERPLNTNAVPRR